MSNTLQDRLNKIQQAGENLANAEVQKQRAEEEKREQLFNQIKELAPRIKELVTLANSCINNGVPLTTYREHDYYGKGNYFFTDGWYHHLGFYDEPLISYIGIKNGGACGIYHLMVGTDGEVKVTMDRGYYTTTTANKKDISTGTLKRFVNEFSEFETRFLNWVDNLN